MTDVSDSSSRAQMPSMQPAVVMRNITKRFPLVLANDRVNFSVNWGEVHALVGENGAGKSTLMKILYGMQRPDEGEIEISGRAVSFADPKDAIRLGIGMVHQHFMLVEPLSVAENIVLGAEPRRNGSLDRHQAQREVTAIIKRFGFSLSPEDLIEELPVGLQQKVEILKTIYRQAKILILDEPTAVLTPLETEELFAFLRSFAAEGNAVIFISHKLREVIEVSDRISVMRDGRMIGQVPTKGITAPEIARMMVGREVLLHVDKKPSKPGSVVLELEHVTVPDHEGRVKVRDVSFQVHQGEIVGIAGVEGNGQSELTLAITGLHPYAGTIRLLEKELFRPGTKMLKSTTTGLAQNLQLVEPNARTVREAGLSHIPEDRNERGLVLEFSTALNLILGDVHAPFVGPLGLLNFDKINAHALEIIKSFDVRPRNTDLAAKGYSGGNAQKIVVGRELSRTPKVLVASQPTRGVDVGSIEFIHRSLIKARDEGLGVLLVSADLGEVMSLADRILVMYEGEIVGEVSGDVSEEQLGLLMAGVRE